MRLYTVARSPSTRIARCLALLIVAVALVASAGARPARATGQSLLIVGNTARGAAGLPPDQLPFLACTVQNRYPQGAAIVFRMKVIDPETGQALDDSQVVSLTLTLADGTTQAFEYGGHPPGPTGATDYFWSTAWTVPADYPTGTLDFQITALDVSGRTGTYQQFNVAPSLVQIVPVGQR